LVNVNVSIIIKVFKLNISLYGYELPLTQSISLKGKLLDSRQGIVISITDETGQQRFADVAPLPGFSQNSLEECLNQLICLCEGTKHCAELQLRARQPSLAPEVAFAIDCALSEIGLLNSLHAPCSNEYLIPLYRKPEQEQTQQSKQPLAQSVSAIKVKVANGDIEQDIAKINQVCQQYPLAKLRLDANQQWSLIDAKYLIEQIPVDRICYIEEPCQSLTQSIELAEQTGIKLALDESLRLMTVDELGANYSLDRIDTFVIKPSLMGSFRIIKQWLKLAKTLNIHCYLSSSFESSFGIKQLYLLHQLWQVNALGLDTEQSFKSNLIVPAFFENKPLISLSELSLLWKS